MIWLFALALGSFLVWWVFADLLHVTRTAYIRVLTVVAGGFLVRYLSWGHQDWGAFISHQWGGTAWSSDQMHFLFGVQFVRRETRDWQARVEQRAREIHAQ